MNEEVDPMLVILRLKREITDLKQEIRVLRGEEEEVTEDEIQRRRHAMRNELIDYCRTSTSRDLNLDCGMLTIRYGYQM